MTASLHPEQERAVAYLRRKGTEAPIATLHRLFQQTARDLEALFDQVSPAERGRAPAPGKWSAHAILDHPVLSHRPAVVQLSALLSGQSAGGVAIPAGLISPEAERRPWAELLAELQGVHRELEQLAARAQDELSLAPKAVVEMVIKVTTEDGSAQPLHWFEALDWKAFFLAIRVHTLEHHQQLTRTLETLRRSAPILH